MANLEFKLLNSIINKKNLVIFRTFDRYDGLANFDEVLVI